MVKIINSFFFCKLSDDLFFGLVWVRNETKLESICNRTKDKLEQTDEFEPWCSIDDDANSDQKENCISFYSGRDVLFSYTSCEESLSALCKTTGSTCRLQITIPSDLNTTQPISTLNVTQSVSRWNSTFVARLGPTYPLTSRAGTNSRSNTIQSTKVENPFSSSTSLTASNGKYYLIRFDIPLVLLSDL